MQKIKVFFNHYKWFILIILIMAGWFYWFQFRPEIKAQECIEKVKENYNATWKIWDDDGDGKLARSKAEILYKQKDDGLDRCIRMWK